MLYLVVHRDWLVLIKGSANIGKQNPTTAEAYKYTAFELCNSIAL